ncbi:MAG: antitoxin VapB family protein [Promethearchaeota archaeon]
MASQQISIKQEVYTRLKQAKKPHESFSDTIERLLVYDSNVDKILASIGSAGPDEGDDAFEQVILDTYTQSRSEFRKNFKSKFS